MNRTEYRKDILYKQLKSDILLGKYPPLTKLPKELDFAKELGVGKVTLRSALDCLEKDGLIARLPSRGTFVLEQSFKKKELNKILVITSNQDQFESPTGYILPEIIQTASRMELGLEICERSFIESFSQKEFDDILHRENISGIIALMSNFLGSEPIVAKLNATGLPVVLPHAAEHDTKITGFASVIIQEHKAWEDAITHLCAQGHSRIATMATVTKKIRGYNEKEHLELLKKHGAESSPTLMGYALYDKEAVRKVMDKWLLLDNPPTAILCFSDFFAIHVYEILKERNIRIPDDIAVMGCCGYPGSAFLSPSLSTVDFEYERLGAMSVELIAKSDKWHSTKEKTAPPIIIKPHKLKIRESAKIKRVEKIIMEELTNV